MLQEFAAGAEGLGLSTCHDVDEEEEADDDDGADCVDGVAALSVVTLRVSELGKPLDKRSAVQTEIRQIAFQPPPPLKQTDALWELFWQKSVNFLKQLF